jgi:DNA-binding HxlR family transcriptional regulator
VNSRGPGSRFTIGTRQRPCGGRDLAHAQLRPVLPDRSGSEILAERWTPIIVRNVLLGCRTFNEIAAGAPGLSRALLTRRLRELERAGVLEIRPKPGGHGSLYEPTPAGQELLPVLIALGGWAERWTQVTAEHADPGVVLWSWCQEFLRRDLLPDRRVVVRFDTRSGGRRTTGWMLIERGQAEICRVDPGFGDDLVVTITDPLTFARWHLGLVGWAAALRSGHIQVTGPRALCRALPTWNAGPETNARRRRLERAPADSGYPTAEGPSGSAASGAGGGLATAGSSSTRRP